MFKAGDMELFFVLEPFCLGFVSNLGSWSFDFVAIGTRLRKHLAFISFSSVLSCIQRGIKRGSPFIF